MKKQLTGTQAPEVTKQPAIEADLLSMTQDRPDVLDHNARLFFDLDPNGSGKTPNLYSFFSEYQEYLDEYEYVDVSNKETVKRLSIWS